MRNALKLVAVVSIGLMTASLRADAVGHWKLDESSGETTAADSAGGHTGTLHGDAAFETGGISGNCLHVTINGNGFVDIGDYFRFTTGDYALVAWAKTAIGDETHDYFVLCKHRSTVVAGYLMGINANGPYGATDKAWFYQSAIEGNDVISTSNVNDGNWHQIVCVYRQSRTAKIYVDGAPYENSKPSATMKENDAHLAIAAIDFSGTLKSLFNGNIDDVQIYNHHLNDAQVQYLFDHPGETVIGPLGDMDCNGGVDFNDIDAFVTALIDEGSYDAAYPDCEYLHADMDYNGFVTFEDIDGFVDVLAG